jgi:hypothetical protein
LVLRNWRRGSAFHPILQEPQVMRHVAFADFYRLNNNGGYDAACGDRSVLILDGRERRESHHEHAKVWAKKHGFTGYRLARGTFSNPFYLTATVQAVTP